MYILIKKISKKLNAIQDYYFSEYSQIPILS